MRKDYCHITAIIDRSGSMAGLQTEVIGGYNSFVADQRKVEGKATMSLIQFDNMYEVNYDTIDIKDVPNLNEDTYVPRGMTAMYDAIGKAITTTGAALGNMEEGERPSKVIILIQTDGAENASNEFTQSTVKKMITEQEDKYSWEFVFLGSNINASSVGTGIGIKVDNTMTYANTGMGTRSALHSLSKHLADVRYGSKADMSYTVEDINAQADAGV